MNGASEALLEELLAQSKTQTQILQQLAKGFTGGGGGSGGTSGLTGSFANANIAVKALSAGFNLLSGIVGTVFKIFGSLVGTVFNLASAFDKLGATALKTGITMTDVFRTLTSILKDIPILGRVMNFFTELSANADRILESYKELSKSGASFGGSLSNIVQAVKTTNLTLDALNKVLANNRDAFAILGAGDVQKGFDKFIKTQDQLMGPDSSYRRQILALGITAEEAAGFIGTMVKSQGVMGKNREIDEGKLAKQTSDYILQLDALTRLTGIQRDAIDEQVRKAQGDQLFQLFVDSITDPAQKEYVNQMLAGAALMGEDAVVEMKARLRGVDVPLTDFGRRMTAFSGGLFLDGVKIRDGLKNATTASDATADLLTMLQPALGNLLQNIGSMGPEAQALIPQLQGLDKAISLARMSAQKDMPAMLAEIRKTQKQLSDSEAQELLEARQDAQNLGLAFADISMRLRALFYPIMTEVFAGFTGFSTEMTSVVKALISSGGFKDTITAVAQWFKTAFGEVREAFSQGGFKAGFRTLFDNLIEGSRLVWTEIKDPIIEVFEGLINWLKPYFGDLIDFIYDSLMNRLLPSGKEEREAVSQMNSARRQMEYINSLLLKSTRGSEEQLILSARFAEQQARYNAAKAKYDEIDIKNAERRINTFGAFGGGGFYVSLPTPKVNERDSQTGSTVGMTGNWWEKPNNVLATQPTVEQQESMMFKNQDPFSNFNYQEYLNTTRTQHQELRSDLGDLIRSVRGLNGNLYAQ